LFGVPRGGLRGDIVLMNQTAVPRCPFGLVKFTEDGKGNACYLDTAIMDAEEECPVVRLDADNQAIKVANNFLDFLRAVSSRLL
jgi:hypothetical protein